ncbi:MAG TPA: hypothetical protein VLH08_04165 [Acidobacteriota bacterium]|nr:hypothetical protein [Acidobacteriota bacterium]
MKFRLVIFLVLNFLVIAISASAEPTIRQLFPKQTLFLGEFVDWTIEVRHPLWESYELKLMSPRGAEMKCVPFIGSELFQTVS